MRRRVLLTGSCTSCTSVPFFASVAVGISLLGRLSIECDGIASPAAFSGRRSELVFAYLVAEHRRDVSRDELADALWPQELPDAWAAALRGVVSDVRRVIARGGLDASDVLERTGSGYRLRLPPDAVVDLDELRSALAAARAHVEDDAARAAADADRAARLARLPFLPRHEGDWVERVRRELAQVLAEALELSARAHLHAGDTRAAAAAAARLVEAEPYSDAAHCLRIEVLAASGDQAGALGAYQQCRAALVDELGVEPSAKTQAALQRALDSVPVAGVSGPPAAPAGASPLASLSVLVVDDHDFQRRTALALLGRLGVGSLAESPDGGDALEQLAASTPPDVIVCDIDMPGMDGVEFIRNVAERRLASAVLIASGLDRSVLQAVEAVGEGYGLQVLGAIEKPLTARRLSERLAAYRRPSPPDAHAGPAAATDAELRSALDEGRVGASFVPIVDLQNGSLRGVRAVATLRPQTGDARYLMTGRFGSELAARLTEHVLAGACEQLRELAGLDLELWLAIGGDSLADVAQADRLITIVRGRGADPGRIVCSVGERALRRSTPAELDLLTRLRVKGFGVCLTDFAGGHGSDDALARIPLTTVALAPSLLRGAALDQARAAALEDALESIRALGLPAVAFGCDDASDYELLMQVGCRFAEGDFIAGALPASELADWARAWQPPPIIDRSR